jgi:PAS domain S-box-containing protein
MPSRLPLHWLEPPRFADPEIGRLARTAHTCALTFAVVVTLWMPAAYLLQEPDPMIFVVGLTADAALLGVAALARRGYARGAALALVTMIFCFAGVGMWMEGGLVSTSVGTYLAGVVAASLFFSAREAWIAAGVATAMLLTFGLLEGAGMLPPKPELTVPRVLVSSLTMIAIMVVLVQLSVGRIRDSQRFVQQVADATPNAIYVFDVVEGKLSYSNAAARKQLGYGRAPAEEEGGVQRVIHPDDLAALGEHTRSVLGADDDESLVFEYRARAADGSWRTIRDRSRVFERGSDGQVRQIMGIAEDVTAEVETQRALEQGRERLRRSDRMEALGQLAGGIAHDFNNYLTVILGSSSVLIEMTDSEGELNEIADEIHEAARRSADLTRQLLAFSRHQLLQPRVLDLADVLNDSLRLLRRVVPENIRIDVLPGPDVPCVLADPAQLEQVVLNLALNARDAMPEGGSIALETRALELEAGDERLPEGLDPGPWAVLRVSDTGHGMDEETQRQMFEPLFTTKAAGVGTGFGLATVEAIIRQTGGSIRVESEVGRGTAFEMLLPATEEAVERGGGAATQGARGPRGGERILLVEDDPRVRSFARRSLASKGYRVSEFPDGEAALDAFSASPDEFDLVLTDVMMPGISGLELAERLRSLQPELAIVFMSGYSADSLEAHGLTEKQVVIHKPFTIEDLEARMREALGEG